MRYDINYIPYGYIVEVMNRLKGLDLVDRVPKELWREVHNIVQKIVTKTIPKKNVYIIIMFFLLLPFLLFLPFEEITF